MSDPNQYLVRLAGRDVKVSELSESQAKQALCRAMDCIEELHHLNGQAESVLLDWRADNERGEL